MNKKRMSIGALILAVVAGLALTGCSRGDYYSRVQKKADFAVNIIASELDLTDAQKTKLIKIKDEALVKFKESHADREAQYIKTKELIKSEKLDTATLDKVFTEREARMKTLKPFIIEKIVEFHNILTPEQKNKLVEGMDKMHKRMN